MAVDLEKKIGATQSSITQQKQEALSSNQKTGRADMTVEYANARTSHSLQLAKASTS